MREVIFGVLLLAVSVSVTGQTPTASPAASQTPAGDAQKGQKLYVSYGCYGCHNYQAQGGLAGPRLAPRPIPFAALSKYVRHPANQMPPYTEKLVSDQELADIYAFLLTIPAPPAVSSLPLLKE